MKETKAQEMRAGIKALEKREDEIGRTTHCGR